MSFLASEDYNMRLKNIYFKTDDDEWKLLADNIECAFCPDGLKIEETKNRHKFSNHSYCFFVPKTTF